LGGKNFRRVLRDRLFFPLEKGNALLLCVAIWFPKKAGAEENGEEFFLKWKEIKPTQPAIISAHGYTYIYKYPK